MHKRPLPDQDGVFMATNTENTVVDNNTPNKKQVTRKCYIFVGPPGAGKGTVANTLSESEKEKGGKGFIHLSTGELLRKERETNQFIKDNWSYDMLETIAFELLEKEIERSEQDIILDGCPKTNSDAKKLADILAKTNVSIAAVISFQLENDKVLQRRITGRLTHPSRRVYHEKFNPPKETNKDDVTGEELTKRHDDTDEIVLRRIQRSRTNLDEVLDFYVQSIPTLVRGVNAELDPAAVLAEVRRIIANPSSGGEVASTGNASVSIPLGNLSTEKISEFVSNSCVHVEEKGQKQKLVDEVLRLAGARINRFPGAHPTALTRENLNDAFSSQYHVAIKSDGVRYLVLIMRNEVFLVNRKMEVFKCKGMLGTKCTETLLDAEVVQLLPSTTPTKSATPPTPEFGLLVFDALSVNGRSVKSRDIMQRMGAVRPYFRDPGVRGTLPFAIVECKPYYPVSQINTVLDLVPKVNHNTDGLIFVGSYYKLGYDTKLFKWKPSAFNTADFLLRIPDPNATHYELYCNSFTDKNNPPSNIPILPVPTTTTTTSTANSETTNSNSSKSSKTEDEEPITPPPPPLPLSPSRHGTPTLSFCDWIRSSLSLLECGEGSVVECYWEHYDEREKERAKPRVGEWKFMRKREDKLAPNADWVVKGIMDSLASDILESELRGL